MKSLKILFLFSLFVSFSIVGVHAGPKRIFDPKNDRPSLTVAEQTNLNRAAAERTESGEDESEDEEENPSKRARGDTLPHIFEAPSQAASEGQEMASSSSSAPAVTAAPVRFLRTNVIPALKRSALDKLMTLPATHPVFGGGLPLMVEAELIIPYFDKINEMIQDAHQACQRYYLYHLPPDVKENNILISVKKSLQEQRTMSQNKLLKATERDYPNALFRMDSVTKVFPKFEAGIDHLKEGEDYKKQAKLARSSGQIERAGLLGNIVVPLNQQASLLFKIAKEKITLQQQLLKDSPDAEIEFSHRAIANHESRLAQITPIIERQKIFLGRLGEFSSVQQSTVNIAFQSSLRILNELEAASAQGDEEGVQLLQQQNAHDQTIKAMLSTDPRVQRIQEKIVLGNEKVAAIASMIVDIKAEQRRMTTARVGRLTSRPSGEIVVQSESDTPIFNLYQIPSSFLDKGITLLQEAQADFLAGRGQLAFQKEILAGHWCDLATETAKSVNALSQIRMVFTPGDLLSQNEIVVRAALIAREAQLATQAATLPVDASMASLPWDFNKTFEENVEALHQEE